MSRILTPFFQVERQGLTGSFSPFFSEVFLISGLFLVLIIIAPGLGSSEKPRSSLTDASGVELKLGQPPKRIVTLIPSLGELAALFLGQHLDRMVGVSEFTDFPAGLKSKKNIGPYVRVNIEVIASLRPDLILASKDGNAKDQIDRLRNLGLTVLVVSTENFREIKNSMKLVSVALGDPAAGDKLVARFESGLKPIEERGRIRVFKKRVLLQLGDSPLISVGKKAFLNEAIEFVGAINLYGDLDAHYPRPSIEDVLKKNPDVIVILGFGAPESELREWRNHWKEFKQVSAVAKNQIKKLDGDEIFRPTLRLIEGLKSLESAIYAE